MAQKARDFTRVVQSIRAELEASFETRNWLGMSSSLDQLVSLTQEVGQRELCIRAQSMRDLARSGTFEGTEQETSASLQVQWNELVFLMDHFEWRFTAEVPVA